jgi:DNA-binding LacI/PurR family transcriptional regulator
MAAIREAGLSIPDDMALMGFDDTFAASVVSPQLSTVSRRLFFPGPGRRRNVA